MQISGVILPLPAGSQQQHCLLHVNQNPATKVFQSLYLERVLSYSVFGIGCQSDSQL